MCIGSCVVKGYRRCSRRDSRGRSSRPARDRSARTADRRSSADCAAPRASHGFRHHGFREHRPRRHTPRMHALGTYALGTYALREHAPRPHTPRRAAPDEGSPAMPSPPRQAGCPSARLARLPLSTRSGRFGPGTLPRVIFLRPAGPLPGLVRGRGELASTLGLAFGFFEAFACALELIFRDAYALLGDVGLQAYPLGGFSRRTVFAGCLLHLAPAKRKMNSLTQGPARFHPG